MVKEKIDDGTQDPSHPGDGGEGGGAGRETARPLSGEKFETVPKLKGRESRKEDEQEEERGPRPTLLPRGSFIDPQDGGPLEPPISSSEFFK